MVDQEKLIENCNYMIYFAENCDFNKLNSQQLNSIFVSVTEAIISFEELPPNPNLTAERKTIIIDSLNTLFERVNNIMNNDRLVYEAAALK